MTSADSCQFSRAFRRALTR